MVPTALRPQGIRSRPRVILQEAGAVVETGCYSRLQITSGECLGVQQELWSQLHSTLRGPVPALEVSYTQQCWIW